MFVLFPDKMRSIFFILAAIIDEADVHSSEAKFM